MNVITSTDGASLLHGLSSNLEGLLYDQRITRSMIDRAKPDLSTVKAYRGSDVAEYWASLARRLRKLRRNRDAANRRVEESDFIAGSVRHATDPAWVISRQRSTETRCLAG